jgi:hypothetical protein
MIVRSKIHAVIVLLLPTSARRHRPACCGNWQSRRCHEASVCILSEERTKTNSAPRSRDAHLSTVYLDCLASRTRSLQMPTALWTAPCLETTRASGVPKRARIRLPKHQSTKTSAGFRERRSRVGYARLTVKRRGATGRVRGGSSMLYGIHMGVFWSRVSPVSGTGPTAS